MSLLCTSCGTNLTSADARCPNCGAVQPSAGPPGPPPRKAGGPPAPPPRRPPPSPPAGGGLTEPDPFGLPPTQASPQPPAPLMAAQPQADTNPFMASPEPSPEPAPSANPFLGADHPTPQPAPSAPQTSAPLSEQQVASLVGRPGVVAPTIKDPHAAFRKGALKRSVLIGGVAALALGAMFYLIPSEPEDETPSVEASAETPAVIGRSVAPEVIQDPNNPVLAASAAKEERVPAAPPSSEEPGPSPDRPDRSGSFAESFKATAR